MFSSSFRRINCHAYKRKYNSRATATFNIKNVMYLIAWKCCSEQYKNSEFIKAILIPVKLDVL